MSNNPIELKNYDRERVVEEVQQFLIKHKKNDKLSTIILQFDQNELMEAMQIQQYLEEIFHEVQFMILSDNLKYSCCIDVIGAKHIKYDLLIHFGIQCFSEDQKLIEQVLSIYPSRKYDLNLMDFNKSIQDFDLNQVHNNLFIIIDQQLMFLQQQIQEIIYQRFNKSNKLIFYSSNELENEQQSLYSNSQLNKNVDFCQQFTLLMICINFQENFYLKNFVVQANFIFKNSNNNLIIYESINNTLRNYNLKNQAPQCIEKYFLQRFYQIQKAKNHEIFGIIISNPYYKLRKEIESALSLLFKSKNKKYYVFLMENISTTKINNFKELQTIILLNCHLHHQFSEKEYMKNIITLYEALISFEEIEWNNYLLLDPLLYQDIINLTIMKYNKNNQQLIDETNQNTSQIVNIKQNNDQIIQNQIYQSLEIYQSRTFKGVEGSFSKEASIDIAQLGSTGIASSYENIDKSQFK